MRNTIKSENTRKQSEKSVLKNENTLKNDDGQPQEVLLRKEEAFQAWGKNVPFREI